MRYPTCSARAKSASIKSIPATRAGSGSPRSFEAHTTGWPSADTTAHSRTKATSRGLRCSSTSFATLSDTCCAHARASISCWHRSTVAARSSRSMEIPSTSARPESVPTAAAAESGSVRTARPEHRGDRSQDEPDVAPQTPAGDVQVVELRHFLERNVVPPEHLPQPGNPRLQLQALPPPFGDEAVLLEDQRPRPDERHLAGQDVQELRQLIERVPAEERAELRHAWVVCDLEHPCIAGLRVDVEVRTLALPSIGVRVHRPEFEDAESLLVCAHP